LNKKIGVISMRTLNARKTQTQAMLEVTIDELRTIMDLNPWVSLGQFDIKNSLKKEGIVGYIAGYIAGDVGKLQLHEKDMKIADHPFDCWFINKDFFDKNYEEVERV
jgi:hypothetical protein